MTLILCVGDFLTRGNRAVNTYNINTPRQKARGNHTVNTYKTKIPQWFFLRGEYCPPHTGTVISKHLETVRTWLFVSIQFHEYSHPHKLVLVDNYIIACNMYLLGDFLVLSVFEYLYCMYLLRDFLVLKNPPQKNQSHGGCPASFPFSQGSRKITPMSYVLLQVHDTVAMSSAMDGNNYSNACDKMHDMLQSSAEILYNDAVFSCVGLFFAVGEMPNGTTRGELVVSATA